MTHFTDAYIHGLAPKGQGMNTTWEYVKNS